MRFVGFASSQCGAKVVTSMNVSNSGGSVLEETTVSLGSVSGPLIVKNQASVQVLGDSSQNLWPSKIES